MAEQRACAYIPTYDCRCDDPADCPILRAPPGIYPLRLTPSADLPACRDEDPATPATLAACYPDPPEYQHPENEGDDGWVADYARAEAAEISAHWEATDDGV